MAGIFIGEGEAWGCIFWFSFQLHLPEGRRVFLSLFRLDQKCRGVSAWWVLLTCKANFIVMWAQWARDYILMLEITTLSYPSLPPGHLSTKKCGFLSVYRFLLSQRPSLVTRCIVSHLVHAPLSLLISRSLPTLPHLWEGEKRNDRATSFIPEVKFHPSPALILLSRT